VEVAGSNPVPPTTPIKSISYIKPLKNERLIFCQKNCPQKIPKNASALPIDFFSVPEFHNDHGAFFVLNGIKNPPPEGVVLS
jgi:hypothetical protein